MANTLGNTMINYLAIANRVRPSRRRVVARELSLDLDYFIKILSLHTT